MVWFVLLHLGTLLVDLLTATRRTDRDNDLEILLLRHQLRLLQRERPRPPCLSRWEKLTLAVLTAKLRRLTASPRIRLERAVLLFKPDTVLGWHRELVRRKWITQRRSSGGRPAAPPEVEALVLRLARDNPGWGYRRIQGELVKLGHRLSHTTVRAILERHGLPPAPERRRRGNTWRQFLARHQHQVLACDFFTVETVFLKTIYGLFFVELGTRRVRFAGCTAHPTAEWMAQQARHLSWQVQDGDITARYLLHDRDSKYVPGFDAVFRSEGVAVVKTPYRTPTANAIAERWVRSVRRECLDHLLIVSEAHLRRVLTTYIAYYNEARPHQGLGQRTPVPPAVGSGHGPIRRRDRLGGLLREYYREAA